MFSVDDCKLHCESLFVPHVVYFVFCLFRCIYRCLIADFVVLVCVELRQTAQPTGCQVTEGQQ